MQGPIGVFDSGYGGLTILKEIVQQLPDYDYLYLGDNARAPYGNRSFDTVYHYTLEAVNWFFQQGCSLVILACNTASAKALRTIQQKDLPRIDPHKRVLGIIRPTTEIIGDLSRSGSVGILATKGTVESESYLTEINKFFPDIRVVQHACPMWVPLVENNEYNGAGADYFIKKDLNQLLKKDERIDTILLACTHYPLLLSKIKEFTPVDISLITQGAIVAKSLERYLKRHPEIERHILKNGERRFFTTDSDTDFNAHATMFYGKRVLATQIELG